MPVNLIGARINLLLQVIFLLAITVFVAVLITMLGQQWSRIVVLLVVILAAIALAALIIVHLYKTGISYTLQAGQIATFAGDLVEGVQGKVVMERTLLAKQKRYLGMSEFDRISVIRPVLGRIFDYGTIRMEQVHKLSDTRDYRLPYVSTPDKYAKIIQEMIDLERNSMQPFGGMGMSN